MSAARLSLTPVFDGRGPRIADTRVPINVAVIYRILTCTYMAIVKPGDANTILQRLHGSMGKNDGPQPHAVDTPSSPAKLIRKIRVNIYLLQRRHALNA
jgi:hypothetical protein